MRVPKRPSIFLEIESRNVEKYIYFLTFYNNGNRKWKITASQIRTSFIVEQ